tara:strand:- start:288 stop:611 length:324 start_codon:yes stop_codon:yes gene_type:complete
MEKPALRSNRFKNKTFSETKWTKSSMSLGEYVFRRISLDQSNKTLQKIRPRHQMSKLIISAKEINAYVNDYLAMLDKKRKIKSDLKDKKCPSRISSYSSIPENFIIS